MATAKICRNPLRSNTVFPIASMDIADFHRRMPAFAPTLLIDAPSLAKKLGVGRVLVKQETSRLGLPSFKILGASWATYQALLEHVGRPIGDWENSTELAARFAHLKPFKLATATDGNHGRAVAFMARLLGFDAHVFVPKGTAKSRIRSIAGEGAKVTIVDSDYDAAVTRSVAEANDRCLVISDTSWPGYETVPANVIAGYATIFTEVDEAIAASGLNYPDAVAIPVGVGALMCAAVTHYRSAGSTPSIVGVEPLDANCVQASVMAGEMVTVPGPHHSIMVGLNCGTASLLAWPKLSSGVDWFVSVDDTAARQAMTDLAVAGVAAGETGAASLAGMAALLAEPGRLEEMHLDSTSTVLLIATEGATDPDYYRQVVGLDHRNVGRVLTAI